MPPSRPAAPFLFPFPIILEQILPVPCQMDSYISKAHHSWNEVGKVIWTPKPVMLCFCYCLSGGNTGFLGMFFLQVGCVLQGLCGLCISSWLLLQYEPELGAEKSCLRCYPGRDFLSTQEVGMGCGPHLYGCMEGDALGGF